MAATRGELLDKCIDQIGKWAADQCPEAKKVGVWRFYSWPQVWTHEGNAQEDEEVEKQTVVIRILAVGPGVREFCGVFHDWRPAYYLEGPTRAFMKALDKQRLPGPNPRHEIEKFGKVVTVPKNWLGRALDRILTTADEEGQGDKQRKRDSSRSGSRKAAPDGRSPTPKKKR